MLCPECGSEMPDFAAFCGSCGTKLSPSMEPPASASEPASDPASAQVPVTEKSAVIAFLKNHIGYVVLAIVLAALLAFIAVPLIREQVSTIRDEHHVTFVMHAPRYNDHATAIPIRVTGTKADGAPYDKMLYLDGGGNGVVLQPGTYTLSCVGGSILENGTLLLAPEDVQLQVEVPQGLPRNAFVQVPPDQYFEFRAVSPADIDEKTLEYVYMIAAANPADNGKAEKLRDNALEIHKQAAATNEEKRAALNETATGPLTVSVGDTARFVGTLQLCSPEEVAERLQDESVTWNYYGRRLAVLWLDEPRQVTREYPEQTGDYGWYDDEGAYHPENMYRERYEMRCLLLSNDVDGIYSYAEGDDGTLAGLDGRRVLVTGKVSSPDWADSQISPITLANPQFEAV